VPRTAGMGHGPALLSIKASGRCRFSQKTFAGSHGNGRDAPIPAIASARLNRPHTTQSGPSSCRRFIGLFLNAL